MRKVANDTYKYTSNRFLVAYLALRGVLFEASYCPTRGTIFVFQVDDRYTALKNEFFQNKNLQKFVIELEKVLKININKAYSVLSGLKEDAKEKELVVVHEEIESFDVEESTGD